MPVPQSVPIFIKVIVYRCGVVECLPQVMRVLLMDAPRHVLAAESKVHQVDQVLALLSQTNQQVRGLQRKDTVILGKNVKKVLAQLNNPKIPKAGLRSRTFLAGSWIFESRRTPPPGSKIFFHLS